MHFQIICLSSKDIAALTDTEEPLQVKGKGGVNDYSSGGESMIYVISLPKDHPDGYAPQTIIGNINDFRDFEKALDIMATEIQVLILVDTKNISGNNIDKMASKLPEGSWIQHHRNKQDNTDACAWVKAHLHYYYQTEMKKRKAMVVEEIRRRSSKENKKYLIAGWYTSAGFEFPAVIWVTKKSSIRHDDRTATYCQRAKAKLVIYHAL